MNEARRSMEEETSSIEEKQRMGLAPISPVPEREIYVTSAARGFLIGSRERNPLVQRLERDYNCVVNCEKDEDEGRSRIIVRGEMSWTVLQTRAPTIQFRLILVKLRPISDPIL